MKIKVIAILGLICSACGGSPTIDPLNPTAIAQSSEAKLKNTQLDSGCVDQFLSDPDISAQVIVSRCVKKTSFSAQRLQPACITEYFITGDGKANGVRAACTKTGLEDDAIRMTKNFQFDKSSSAERLKSIVIFEKNNQLDRFKNTNTDPDDILQNPLTR